MARASCHRATNAVDATPESIFDVEGDETAANQPRHGANSDRPNAFEQAVRLVRDNEQLFATLRVTRLQLRQARAYLAHPQSNPTLARLHLDRIRAKHSAILAQLRSNRIEANVLLGGGVASSDQFTLNLNNA